MRDRKRDHEPTERSETEPDQKLDERPDEKLSRRDALKGGLVLAVALTTPGCSGPTENDAGADVPSGLDVPRSDAGAPDSGGRDTGTGTDTGPGIDSGMDSGLDSGMDTGSDAGGVDVGSSDANVDGGSDAPLDPVDPPESVPESALFTLGVASGDVTVSQAILWTSYAGSAPLEVVVWEMSGDTYLGTAYVAAVTPSGAYVHHDAIGLYPDRQYRYTFFELTGTARTGRSTIGRFRTPPADDALRPVTFGAVSCISNTRPIGTIGHAGGRTDLSFFAFLGDSTYNDGARTVAQYRTEWESNVSRPEYRALRAATGAFVTWDDHEFDNDLNPETFPPAALAAAKQVFFEHLPLRRDLLSPDRIYKRMRWGGTLEVFVLDCRAERLPSTRSTPGAQYISRAQMDWLKAGLLDSTAVFKVILNSVPITDCPGLFDLAPADRWEGYAAQRTEILRHIDDSALTGVLWVAGDFHLCSGGRVSPSGVGASQIEVLVGPGAQSANPLSFKLRPPQFDFASGTNNYSVITLDPATVSATVQWVDASGRAFQTRTYAL